MKQSLQSLADARLAPEWRQTVKTYDDAASALGWDAALDVPICCGRPAAWPNPEGDGSKQDREA